MATPRGATPARVPASWPREGDEGESIAVVSLKRSGWSAASAMRRLPMRPAAPAMAREMVDMASPRLMNRAAIVPGCCAVRTPLGRTLERTGGPGVHASACLRKQMCGRRPEDTLKRELRDQRMMV